MAFSNGPRTQFHATFGFWYGNHYLLPIGHPAEAMEAMALGLEGDQLNLLYRHHWARGLRHVGRLEDAAAELRKVLEIDENFPPALDTLAAICAQQGRFADALALAERAYALTPWSNPIIGQLAALLVHAGDTRRVRALIEELRPGKAYGASDRDGNFSLTVREFDRATKWAEQAIESVYPGFLRRSGAVASGPLRTGPSLRK